MPTMTAIEEPPAPAPLPKPRAAGRADAGAAPAGAPVAELSGVVKRSGAVAALAGVDLALRAGELTALLGPNGAGKTTLVRHLLGLSRPDSGRVRVFGSDPASAAARVRSGAMLQVGSIPQTLRVGEHLDLFASYYRAPLPLAEVMAAARLSGLEDRPFGKLSGGQQRRLLFALALIGDPELLLLDEPTVGLDVEARRGLWDEIRRLVARGRTLLLTTHYLEEADALADRVVVLHQGRIVADGPPSEIKAKAALKRVRCTTRLTTEEARELPGASRVRRDGAALEILCTRPEALLAELLARDPGVDDLEVGGAGLEEAFLALTGNGRAPAAGTAENNENADEAEKGASR